jgi:putative spermidine/putrescine transport system substrate-binding protein
MAMRGTAAIAVAAALAILAGCGGGGNAPPGELGKLGTPENRLDLVALPGYVEDGSHDPRVDWVTPFERQTGCEVTSTVASSPPEVTRLMRSGRYDGASARGDVSRGLIAEHLVAPVNTSLISSYSSIFPSLKRLPSNSVDGVPYGVPTGRSADFLVWRTDVVPMPHREPASSNVIFDPSLVARYPGRVTAYDDPMSIANAALYLRRHNHGLGIGNVYELDPDQFQATISLLREQASNLGPLWRTPAEEARNFASDATVVGAGWQTGIDQMLRDRLKIKAAIPKEGTTGRSDSWMISSHARHPTCMYLWMNYMEEAIPNARLAERTGQAPANEHACDETAKTSFCDTYRAADEDLFHQVSFWTTPLRDCGDGRGDVCATYADWTRAWTEVTGR